MTKGTPKCDVPAKRFATATSLLCMLVVGSVLLASAPIANAQFKEITRLGTIV